MALPKAPTPALPAHPLLLLPPPARLSLGARVWSEVGRSPAPMPNPVSRPIPPAGSASRRCLLSAQGVAYWGLPSFARCISHEYRYLYLSVSVPCGAGWCTGSVPGSGWGWRELASCSGPCALADICCLAVPLPGCAPPCPEHSYSHLKAQPSSVFPCSWHLLLCSSGPPSLLVMRCRECSSKCLCPLRLRAP